MLLIKLKYRISLSAIVVMSLLYGISIGMNFVIIPLYFEQHNLSSTHISGFLSIEIFAPLFLMPFFPKLVAKIGTKNLIIISLLFRNLAIMLLPFQHSQLGWILTMTCFGLGGYSLFNCLQLWVNNICHNVNRSTTLGILNCSISIGTVLGPILLKQMQIEDAATFISSSLICSAAILPIFWAKRFMPRNIKPSKIKISVLFKKVPLAIIAGMTMDFIFYSLSSFLVIYGIQNGLSKTEAAFLITTMLMGALIFDIPLGYLSDKLNRKVIMFVCCLIILCTSQILPYVVTNLFKVSILFTFLCGAMGTIYTNSLALIGDRFKGTDLIAASASLSF